MWYIHTTEGTVIRERKRVRSAEERPLILLLGRYASRTSSSSLSRQISDVLGGAY